jgi:hypothetical protein
VNRVPFGPRDRSRPYFGGAAAPVPRAPAGRVVANARCCNELVVKSYDDRSNELPTVDAMPVAEGAFVFVQGTHRDRMAVPYDAAIHAGWKRYAAHVCKAK